MRVETAKGPRRLYIEAFPNEPKKDVELEARRFDYQMRKTLKGRRETNNGILLPN